MLPDQQGGLPVLDNEIFKNVIDVMRAGLTAQGYPASPSLDGYVAIQQNFQPTNQGANTGQTLYIHKIGDHRYGFPERTDFWDQDNETEVHTERQLYESMFQVTALAILDPSKPPLTQKTASDICNVAAAIMQSDFAVDYLTLKGLNLYRVTEVRNPYFIDDKDRYEGSPSFDFTLQHEQVIISTSPVVEDVTLDIERV